MYHHCYAEYVPVKQSSLVATHQVETHFSCDISVLLSTLSEDIQYDKTS